MALADNHGLQFIRVRCLLAFAAITAADGDVGAARDQFEQARATAEDNTDALSAADALAGLARVAADRGQPRHAKALHGEALTRRQAIPDLPGIADGLKALAELAADEGRWAYAARLSGAAARIRSPDDGPPLAPGEEDADPVNAHLRQALGAEEFAQTWAQGAATSWHEAIAYATRGRGRHRQAAKGWQALTPTERQVADLARQRLTNAEIAQRLFIAPRTVGNHLHRIYAKLDVSSRHQLDDVTPTDGE